MSIAQAEVLKQQLTDKYVVVAEGVPELRRFVGLTGTVKTVNMNCRALVQFDSGEDISWYDIDPSYLKVVDQPLSKKKAAPADEAKPAAPAKQPAKAAAGKSPLELARQQGAADAKPAAKTSGKPSPLELARQQGAAGSGAGAAAPAKKSDKSGLSPLELARQQGATKSDGAKTPAQKESQADTSASKPAETKTPGKKLSPLELARQQGAFSGGAGKASEAAAESSGSVETAVEEPEPQPAASEKKKAEVPTGPGGKPLSKIELARLQGPAKQ